MARKKLSPIEKEYNKQLRNLNKRIKRAEEKGYIYLVDPTPSRPKKIKPESVEKIKNIRGEKLIRKSSAYTSPFTGETLSPKSKQAEREAKEFERQKREALKLARQGKDISDYAEIVQSYAYGKIKKPIQEPPDEWFQEYPEEAPGVDPGIIGAIRNSIDVIPDVKYYGYDNDVWYTEIKKDLHGMLTEYLTAYEDTPYYKDYVIYLYENEEEIITCCEDTIFESKQENVNSRLNRLTELLKGGKLSMTELKAVEKVNEYYENYEV